MTAQKILLANLILWGTLTPIAAAAMPLAEYQTPKQEAQFLQAQQPDGNRDRFLQPDEQLPQPLETEDPLFPSPDPTAPNINDPTPITVRTINIVGNTRFTPEDLAPILETISGETTLGAVNAAVAAITQQYIDAGYLTSRAVLPAQPLDGNLEIQVIEGTITDIQITGLNRLRPRYITSRVRQGIGTPLNINTLEDQLRLFNLDANIDRFNTALLQDQELGTSILQLEITEADPFFGTAFIDNYSAAAVGSTRTGLGLGYRNLLGMGDVAGISYILTPAGGSHIWDFNYAVPLNPMNGTIQARFVNDRNKIIKRPFDALGIRGASQLYEISFRQPLIRNPREEFALSLGFTHKLGQTFLFQNVAQPFSLGAGADGKTRTSVLRFGQDYTRRDRTGAWSGRSQFNIGTGLFNATNNANPIPDGQFLSWLGQVRRIEVINPKHQILIEGDLQLTGDNLLSSETFGIGGGQTLRGYRQGARSGDNGFRFVVENRIALVQNEQGAKLLQIAPFVDVGKVWNNGSNPRQIPDNRFLVGLGTGFIWQPIEKLNVRLDFTLPVVNLRDRQNDLQDDGIYFSLSYGF